MKSIPINKLLKNYSSIDKIDDNKSCKAALKNTLKNPVKANINKEQVVKFARKINQKSLNNMDFVREKLIPRKIRKVKKETSVTEDITLE